MKLTIRLPAELEPFADDLEYFFRTMVKKLHANRHKGYGECPLPQLYTGFEGEVMEFGEAVIRQSQFDVLLEGTDVANYAFLIALNATRKEKPDFNSERAEVVRKLTRYPHPQPVDEIDA